MSSSVIGQSAIQRLAEGATQTSGCNLQWDQTLVQMPIPLVLKVSLVEKAIEELQRRKVDDDLSICSIERHNDRVYSVSLSQWIVFLDTESGEPVPYHALPLSVWNE